MAVNEQERSIQLIVLHIFLSIGAIGGGIIFMIDPSGEMAGMSLSLLEGSLFSSYLVPSLILVVVLGIVPFVTAIGLINQWDWKLAERFNVYKDKHWSWSFSLYIGFALIIWITIQVFIIKTLTILHFIYIFYGLIIQIVTLLPVVQRKYTK